MNNNYMKTASNPCWVVELYNYELYWLKAKPRTELIAIALRFFNALVKIFALTVNKRYLASWVKFDLGITTKVQNLRSF